MVIEPMYYPKPLIFIKGDFLVCDLIRRFKPTGKRGAFDYLIDWMTGCQL